MKQMFRITFGVAAATLLGLTALGSTGPAAAAPAGPALARGAFDDVAPAVRARMNAQIPLVDAASVIQSAVEAGKSRGYAGLGLVDGHVTLWWKGAVPADVSAALAGARRIADVRVEAAAYTRTELKTAAAKVSRVVAADPADAAHTVRIKTDGSGLEVAVDTSAGAKIPALPGTGVKTGTVTAKTPKLHATRVDDEASWNGGARIVRDQGVTCTSGFGVRNATTNTPYVLTAAHCGERYSNWTDGAGDPIGSMVERNVDHDTGLISAASAGTGVYTGDLYDGVKAAVVGWTRVLPGQILCQSGQTTADIVGHPICNLEVQFHYTDRQDLVEATQLDGLESGYGGDSGGPLYAVNPDGSVLAAGTHTSGAGSGIGFQDFATARADFGDIVPVDNSRTAPSTCRVSYQVSGSWSGGHTVNVTVYNSAATINGWQLKWNLKAGSAITTGWNAQTSQSGTAVTASNLAYNATIPAGGAITFGFNASGTPTVSVPITLNGQTCS